MSKRIRLTAEEAKVILRTDDNNVDAGTKRLLQKVVDKRPLSEEERGTLEGILSNDRLRQQFGRVTATEDPLGAQEIIAKALLNADKVIETEDRRRIVMSMRCQHPPVPIREIAKRLEVTTDTVMKDIKASKDRFGRILDGQASLQLLGSTVSQYDVIHGKAMALADEFTSPMAKAAFLRTAISALDSKAKLMADTGVIHRVPERQEILVAHADAGSVRERVAKLVRAQEQRTSPTLELPRPRENGSESLEVMAGVDDFAQEDAPNE